MPAQLGIVRGVAEVRDKDGNLKGTFVFEGGTELSEEELRRRLQLSQINEVKEDGDHSSDCNP